MNFFEEFRELSERALYKADGPLGGQAVEMSNPVCGDWVSLESRVGDGVLDTFTYQVRGCWPVQGCLEFLGDQWTGKDTSSLLAWSLQEFMESVEGIPGSKRHAFSLTHRALVTSVLKQIEYSQIFGRETEERV